MLTIYGKPEQSSRFCDGYSRRDFLRIGGMVMGGIGLSQVLSAEAQAGTGRSHKAIINVFLPGGPPHQDFWDVKVDAPAEIRGEFQAIKTNVSGIEISEIFPKIAAIADKCVFIRSMVGAAGGHDAYQCMNGRPLNPAPAVPPLVLTATDRPANLVEVTAGTPISASMRPSNIHAVFNCLSVGAGWPRQPAISQRSALSSAAKGRAR